MNTWKRSQGKDESAHLSKDSFFYRFHAASKEVFQSLSDDAKEFDLVHVIDESVVEDAVDLVDPQPDEFVPVLQSI